MTDSANSPIASAVPTSLPATAPLPTAAVVATPVLSVSIPAVAAPATSPPDPVALEAGATPVRQEAPAAIVHSEKSRNVKIVVEHAIDVIDDMNGGTLFCLATIVAMLVFYSLGNRSPFFILAFAGCCFIASGYGFLHWPWPFGVAGGLWGIVALRHWWQAVQPKNDDAGKANHPAGIWPTRYAYVAAVVCGVILLFVDSPIATHLPFPVSHSIVEAAPLLLVGIAFFAWLAIDRPAIVDLIKQGFIALAFVLWGVDLLMPPGPWATFVGAVVIAIYVFDLAWLMEGNLRKRQSAPADSPRQ